MDNELSQLQGRWRVTGLEVEGKVMKPEQITTSSITIKGTRFTATGPGTLYDGDMVIDTRANPKRLTVTMPIPQANGELNRVTNAIYDVNGDTLRLCVNAEGGPAPPSFATKPGDPYALETLKREPW